MGLLQNEYEYCEGDDQVPIIHYLEDGLLYLFATNVHFCTFVANKSVGCLPTSE
jgi:hypothetical protein